MLNEQNTNENNVQFLILNLPTAAYTFIEEKDFCTKMEKCMNAIFFSLLHS